MPLRSSAIDWISPHAAPGSSLSNPNFRDTYPLSTTRSFSSLRLMGTIIVALLAITMAIFPISMPQAVAHAAHQHVTRVGTGHEHGVAERGHQHPDLQASHDAAAVGLSGSHDPDTQDCTGVVCCSMGACHAFQDTAPPSLFSPAVSEISIALTRDEQVEEVIVGGLDRPPRTV